MFRFFDLLLKIAFFSLFLDMNFEPDEYQLRPYQNELVSHAHK